MTRDFTLTRNLGTEDDPLSVEIDRTGITIQTEASGRLLRDVPAIRVTLTHEQFAAVVREHGYFMRISSPADAAEELSLDAAE